MAAPLPGLVAVPVTDAQLAALALDALAADLRKQARSRTLAGERYVRVRASLRHQAIEAEAAAGRLYDRARQVA